MAQKITMDMELRFIDNTTDGAKSASKAIDNIEKEAKAAGQSLDNLGKKKVKPSIDADSTRIDKKMSKIDATLKKLGFRKTKTTIDADDKATSKLNAVLNKVRNWSGKKFKAFLELKDSGALRTLDKMSNGLRSLTSKAWSIAIKVPSTVFAPLRTLKNTLFNIKTLIGGIATAWAASKVFGGAISVADTYSSAKISFSTLLGESKGQQMMDDLDLFAKKTPFNTTNVIDNAQKMLAMGWNPEDIIKDMDIIGDAAAATGKMDQGLESIVRALSQIKTKGKLSTEELNQLAEAGIAAKAMLAEQMGYGTGDAGIAKMTADLEKGLISSDVALEALLAGMQKYDGMMESVANETVAGLKSQLADAFEINIVRRWGQGLQDGAKRGLGTVLDLLDDAEGALESLGDTVYELGAAISNWAADKLENAVERITRITDLPKFKEASLGGKISMLWNGVVADPLEEWWEGGGRDKAVETAGKIGEWMGKTISDGLLAIFGATDILDDETANKLGEEGGMTIAQSFAKGFKDNFDGSAITDAIVDAIGDVWDALPGWAKFLIGAYGVGKAAGGLASLSGMVGNVAGAVGSTGAMTGILGFGANTAIGLGAGNLAGGASMGGGALAATGLISTAGGIAGAAAVGKGAVDLYKGYTTDDKVEANARKRSGWTAIGGTGAGALAGAAIGSVIPGIGTLVGGLIGAGIGGIGGWIGGNAWADKYRKSAIEDVEMTVGVNITGEKRIQNTIEILAEDFGIPEEHADTVALLLTGDEEILSKIDTTKLSEELGVPKFVAQDVITKLSGTKSIEERVNVLSTDLVDATEVWQTITVNLKAKVGQVIDKVSGYFGGSSNEDSNNNEGSNYRGGIVGGASSLEAFARGGIADYGGMVRGGAKLIKVAEEGSPEMIIPLSSQRRQRGLDLWEKAGQMMGVPGFARGGLTNRNVDEGIRFWGSGETGTSAQTVSVEVGGVHIELHVNADGSTNIVEAIKAQIGEITDAVVGAIADELGALFENTPVRGGA